MMETGLVQVRVDNETKDDVTRIYEKLGLDLPTAIRIFFKKSISVKGLPFDLRDDSSADRWSVYENARKSIQKNKVPEMTLNEINKEISKARKGEK